MASEDVIELGSSEDEPEPAPKKRKPMPNAMVHIPANIPGLTIKPSKPAKTSLYDKGVLSKPIVIKPVKPTITNITRLKANVLPNTIIKRNKTTIPGQILTNTTGSKKEFLINPISIAKNLKQPQMTKSVSGTTLKNPFHTPGSKIINNLPPNITIKKTRVKKHIHVTNLTELQANHPNVVIKKKRGEVLTVNLDEEDINDSSTSSPQWYMRPEESDSKEILQNDEITNPEPSMEEKNNKEPEMTTYVEITIEDSPIKPVNNKHTSEIGRELPITIEDSPIKPKKNNSEGKEIYNDNENNSKKNPQSKKKLDYPNNLQTKENVYEIEIESMETCAMPNNDENVVSMSTEGNEVSKVSSTKDKEVDQETSSKNETADKNSLEVEENHEFQPVYQTFIDTCFKLENSEDMKIIVEKKIKTYYKQCPKEYVESEEFTDMVSNKIISMKAGPEKMYLYIKDIVDELNLQRKMAKSDILNKEIITTESNDKYSLGEYSEYDSKKQRQIRKLEKTIKKLHRAIQKLEDQEVDFDDEDDSVYLLTERYKERMVRVHAKFCQLTNTKMPSEPRILVEARVGRPAGPAKKLEKWINKKVPFGTPLPFPDFHDVICCVREANEEDKLGWNDADITEEARDLFARCGKKLQRRRQENEWRIAASRISTEVDPAEVSDELKRKLNENKLVAAKKESEVLNSFADRQHKMKLEAVEIGEKEAEESPLESEDEEPNESSSLEDKQKRKDRLKRLLVERNKKLPQSCHIPFEENKGESQVVVSEDNEKGSKKCKSINEENKNLHNVESDSKQNKENTGIHNEENVEHNLQTLNTDNIDAAPLDVDELNNNEDKVETLSDNGIESDIDELHLLQKLHSENEINSSTSESSDYDTPIAISDTLDSDSDVENDEEPFDVISIENSSYSESEINAETDVKRDEINDVDQNEELLVNKNLEIEFSTLEYVSKITPISSNEDESENILLASSDEDGNVDGDSNVDSNETHINLKDDSISIGETVILGLNEVNHKEISTDDDAPDSVEAHVNSNVLCPEQNHTMDVNKPDIGSDINLVHSCKSLIESKTDKDEQIERMGCSESNNTNNLEQDENNRHSNAETIT